MPGLSFPVEAVLSASNIVSSGRARTACPRRGSQWEAGTTHVVNHDAHEFDFTTNENLDALALCFQKPLLQQYARKFHGCEDSRLEQITADLLLDSSAGECFSRYAKFVWDELKRGRRFSTLSARNGRNRGQPYGPCYCPQLGVSITLVAINAAEAMQPTSSPAEEFILGNFGNDVACSRHRCRRGR